MEHRRKKQKSRQQRKKRIRRKIIGTTDRPRMSVYRSLKHCYVQLIDDTAGKTLLGCSTRSKELRGDITKTGTIEAARMLGRLVAEKALAQHITRVVFDRNGFLYHGRVKAIAEGAREKGLQF
ncbi:MAG: 50S ribosomal protein L18 [Desulfobacterota bacterium]|nr:50S ribosomal protein L18 [Thermodesulfobacteriota bacterium]